MRGAILYTPLYSDKDALVVTPASQKWGCVIRRESMDWPSKRLDELELLDLWRCSVDAPRMVYLCGVHAAPALPIASVTHLPEIQQEA